MGQDPAAIQQEIAATRERLGETASALADKANVPAQAIEAVREHTAGRSASELLSPEEARRALRGAARMAHENPLGLVFGALAIGFAVGMLLPATQLEDERLGSLSDRVQADVRELGDEALGRARDVGQQVIDESSGAV
jgi:hypothetical protein